MYGQKKTIVTAGINSPVFGGSILLSYVIALPYELSRNFSILKPDFFCQCEATPNFRFDSKSESGTTLIAENAENRHQSLIGDENVQFSRQSEAAYGGYQDSEEWCVIALSEMDIV